MQFYQIAEKSMYKVTFITCKKLWNEKKVNNITCSFYVVFFGVGWRAKKC